MRSLADLVQQLFQRTEPSPAPEAAEPVASGAVDQVYFLGFERGTAGVVLRYLDEAGRSHHSDTVQRFQPAGKGWFRVETRSGAAYRLRLTDQNLAQLRQIKQAADPDSLAMPPAEVEFLGFPRSAAGLRLRFQAGERESLSTRIVRVEPADDGWCVVHTQSGGRYRTRISAKQRAELEAQAELETLATASLPGLWQESTAPEPLPPPALPAHARAASPPEPAPQPSHGRTDVEVRAPRLRPNRITWLGEGQEVQLGEWTLRDPMTYFCRGLPRDDDASCIDLELEVRREGGQPLVVPGYWARYRHLTPGQRAIYLDWLASGRTARLPNASYVMVYFYGLERRALIDRENRDWAMREVTRLLEQYPEEFTFGMYAGSFLGYLLAESGLKHTIPPEWLIDALHAAADSQSGRGLEVALAWALANEQKAPADWARRAAARDPRARPSVVTVRVAPQFYELFRLKYHGKLGEGIRLRAAKHPISITYSPGSPTFYTARGRTLPARPLANVLGIPSQFKPAIEIWNQCVEELRALSRVVGAGTPVNSPAGYAALPPVLRAQTVHPGRAAWRKLVTERCGASGFALIPVAELAALMEYPAGIRLTSKQSQALAETAQLVGMVLEPDFRRTGRAYGPDDVAVLYPSDDASSSAEYGAAALALELGLALAGADSEVHGAEVCEARRCVDAAHPLDPAAVRRLEALQTLLSEHPPTLTWLSPRLRDLPGAAELPSMLVAVAAADGVADQREVVFLRKAGRLLGLDASGTEALVRELVRRAGEPVDTASRGAPGRRPEGPIVEAVLDHDRLREVLAATRGVAQVLAEALREEEPEAPEPPAESKPRAAVPVSIIETEATETSVAVQFEGLEARYQPLLAELITRETWSLTEFEGVVRRHGHFPAGALAVINDWADEYLGDWLIEEGDPLRVQRELLPE